MSIKNYAKKLPAKLAYKVSKGVANFIAPLAAIASTAGNGGDGYLDNLVAVYNVPKQLYEIGSAIVQNEGVRDFLSGRFQDLVSIVSNSAENIVERPLETATAAGCVFLGTKYLPHTLKGTGNLIKRITKKKSYQN